MTTSKRSTKNSSDSFKDDPWGREAKTVYFPRTKELNQEKWDEIFYRCEQILKKRGIATQEQVSEAGSSTGKSGLVADEIDLSD